MIFHFYFKFSDRYFTDRFKASFWMNSYPALWDHGCGKPGFPQVGNQKQTCFFLPDTQSWNYFSFCFLLKITQGGIWAFNTELRTHFVLFPLAMGACRGCRDGTQHPPSVPKEHLCPSPWGQGSLPRQMPLEAQTYVFLLWKKKIKNLKYIKKKPPKLLDSWSGSWQCEGLLKYLCYLLFNFICFFGRIWKWAD